MLRADEALARLREGNRRFVEGRSTIAEQSSRARRKELLEGQNPFAIVLGCSDSRVSAEIIFDQGLGELFVVRVAGNIAAPSPVASVEYAVDHFATPLLVVLGHSHCGAVGETIGGDEHVHHVGGAPSAALCSLIRYISMSTGPLVNEESRRDRPKLYRCAVRANVSACAEQLRSDSAPLAPRVRCGDLVVVGAEYSLASGVVDFFDGVPGST